VAGLILLSSLASACVLTWWDDPEVPFFVMDYDHISRGAYLVGVLGFCNGGFEGFMAPVIWGGDFGRGRPFGALGFMVLIGLFNFIGLVYARCKRWSAVLLQNAESMVLDVAEACDCTVDHNPIALQSHCNCTVVALLTTTPTLQGWTEEEWQKMKRTATLQRALEQHERQSRAAIRVNAAVRGKARRQETPGLLEEAARRYEVAAMEGWALSELRVYAEKIGASVEGLDFHQEGGTSGARDALIARVRELYRANARYEEELQVAAEADRMQKAMQRFEVATQPEEGEPVLHLKLGGASREEGRAAAGEGGEGPPVSRRGGRLFAKAYSQEGAAPKKPPPAEKPATESHIGPKHGVQQPPLGLIPMAAVSKLKRELCELQHCVLRREGGPQVCEENKRLVGEMEQRWHL